MRQRRTPRDLPRSRDRGPDGVRSINGQRGSSHTPQLQPRRAAAFRLAAVRELARGRNATALLCAVALVTAAFIAGGDSTAGAFGAKTTSLKRMATATATAAGARRHRADQAGPASHRGNHRVEPHGLLAPLHRPRGRGRLHRVPRRHPARHIVGVDPPLRRLGTGLRQELRDRDRGVRPRGQSLCPRHDPRAHVRLHRHRGSQRPAVGLAGRSDRDEHHGCVEPRQRQRRRRRLRRPSAGSACGLDRLDAVRGHVAAVRDDVHDRRSRLRRERQPLGRLQRPAHDGELPRHGGPDCSHGVSPSRARTSPPSRSSGSRPPTRTASPATASTATGTTPGRPRAPRTPSPGFPAARAT